MPPKKRSTATRRPAKRRPKRKRVTFRNPIKAALFRCDRCKMTTNNPLRKLFHTCLMGFSASQKKAIRQRTAAQAEASRRNLRKARSR